MTPLADHTSTSFIEFERMDDVALRSVTLHLIMQVATLERPRGCEIHPAVIGGIMANLGELRRRALLAVCVQA